jgi:serine/threonine-protein kinase
MEAGLTRLRPGPDGEKGIMDHATQPQAAGQPPAQQDERTPDLTGKTLGDFHLLRHLGKGGMGQVYLAEQISLKRKVALKLLRADLAADAKTLQRFKAEAEAVARATHANIVQVYAIGEADGLHYMALEYVEGKNLREYLEKKGPPDVLVALSIMRQVAGALQRASELGIIHRDIKPENILVTRKGEVKVTDFGLSRVFADDRQPLNLTQSGVTMGTPLYMSPEQVEGKPVDPRTDIYSFGVTCYHLLAGHPPFRGGSAYEVAFQHVQNEPPPLATIRPDLPPDLCAVVHKMMAKRPGDRYQTGRDIVREVVRLRDVLVGVSGTPPDALISLGPAPSEPFDAIKTIQIPPLRRRRWLGWVLGLGVVLALAGGVGYGWLSTHPGAPPRPAPPPSEADRARLSQKEQEDFLLWSVKQRYADPPTRAEMLEGLPSYVDLGLLYLKDRRLDAADEFFKGLNRPEQRYRVYQYLGKFGGAMVLAFRDKPAESNKQFVRLFQDPFVQKALFSLGPGGLLNRPAFRAMLADALQHNLANAPDAFPAQLRVYLKPPEPTLKTPPKKAAGK